MTKLYSYFAERPFKDIYKFFIVTSILGLWIKHIKKERDIMIFKTYTKIFTDLLKLV